MGLHNSDGATSYSAGSTELRWSDGTGFDSGALLPVSAVSLTAGSYCMTVKRESGQLVFEDAPCSSSLGSVMEKQCFDLGKKM